MARRHSHSPVLIHIDSSPSGSGKTQGAEGCQGQLEAIGIGWGPLAIRDDSSSPPNLSLSDEGWPRIGDTRSNIASQSPMHEHCRMKNLNRPISSWEICQAQRQREKKGD